MQKNKTIYLLKGIAIVGVVAHHIANRRFDPVSREYIGFLGAITDWVVPLFVVISGHLHGLSFMRGNAGFVGFCIGRANRLLVPFVVASVCYSGFYVLAVKVGLLSDPSRAVGPWLESAWLSLTTFDHTAGEQLYFFPLLFVIAVIAHSLIIACSGKSIPLLVTAGILFLSGSLRLFYLTGVPGGFYWEWDRFSMGVAIYLIGFYSASNDCQIRDWVGLALLAGVLLLTDSRVMALDFLFSVVFFLGILRLGLRQRHLERIGAASGTIFLYHTPFFIQPLLIIAAGLVSGSWQIAVAYGILIVVIAVLVLVHEFLSTRNNFLRKLAM